MSLSLGRVLSVVVFLAMASWGCSKSSNKSHSSGGGEPGGVVHPQEQGNILIFSCDFEVDYISWDDYKLTLKEFGLYGEGRYPKYQRINFPVKTLSSSTHYCLSVETKQMVSTTELGSVTVDFMGASIFTFQSHPGNEKSCLDLEKQSTMAQNMNKRTSKSGWEYAIKLDYNLNRNNHKKTIVVTDGSNVAAGQEVAYAKSYCERAVNQ